MNKGIKVIEGFTLITHKVGWVKGVAGEILPVFYESKFVADEERRILLKNKHLLNVKEVTDMLVVKAALQIDIEDL
ncbi:MAG: hypothetical protein C4542_02990 [Dehalococcoidia bacterium]|nr:MAG: hypothetical protein C4542_02990 [Dehalococcoidia bacterium]